VDWIDFLEQHRIEYRTTGKNVARGNVGIRCPFCEDEWDFHMGISLQGRGWHCWRRPEHSGSWRRSHVLIQQLLGCTEAEAKRRAYGDRALPEDGDGVTTLMRRLGAIDEDFAPAYKPTELRLYKEFAPILNGSPKASRFLDYLADRGYDENQLPWLCKHYELHYCTAGKFRNRIIFPVWDRYRHLLTWTGRTIDDDVELRYRSLSNDEGIESVRDCLLGLPLLWKCVKPHLLLVCEGPFDALRVTMLGRHFGIYGTCMFGLSISQTQASLLEDLQERFAHIRLLVDSSASFRLIALTDSVVRLGICRLPSQYKDPGGMPAQALVEFLVGLLNK
jgi:hypothetical protein